MVRVPDLGFSNTQQGMQEVVQETNALQVGGMALEGIGQLQQEKEKRDARAWSIKADTDLRFAAIDELEAAKNEAETPDKIGQLFFDKLETRRNKLGETAPNGYAQEEYNDIYENVRRGFGQQAVQVELAETQKFRQMQVDDAVQSQINFVRNGGSYSDSQVLLRGYFDSLDEVYSPTELKQYKDDAMKQMKGAQLDVLFEQGNLSQVKTLINDPNYNVDLSAKEIGAYRNAIKKQQQAILATKQTDPAKYTKLQGITDPQAMIDYQVNELGIPAGQASILTDDEAKALVYNVNKVQTAEQFTQVLTELDNKYGNLKVNAINDLVKQNLPSAYLYGANLDPVNDAEALSLLFESTRGGEKETKNLMTTKLSTDSKTYSDFENELSSSLSEEIQYFIDEGKSPQTINEIINQAKNIASSAYIKGRSLSEAIDFSLETLQADFKTGEYNGSLFKIPSGYDDKSVNNIEAATKDIVQNIELFQVDEISSGFVLPQQKESAKWVTNGDRSGLILVDEFGNSHLDKDGNLIQYTFDELNKIGAKSFSNFVNKEIEKNLPELQRILRGE